jgi:ParB-like chromosome segregation protein Spo0J
MAKAKAKAKTAGKKRGALDWIIEPLRRFAVPIDSVKLDPANENTHDEASITAIAASLKRYKQRTPIIVNAKTKRIAKGNGTWQAAKQNGETKIAVVFVEDDAQTHAGYRLADNRVAELSEWNDERLAVSIAELNKAEPDLFSAMQLDELSASIEARAESGAGDQEPGASVEIPEHYAVVIEVKNEREQKKLFDRLTGEGLKCKLQTL